MDADRARAISERDQLWASLRVLLPEIERIAQGHFEGTERERQVVSILARITVAELTFRAEGNAE
jgi:hypothetical protein